MCLAIPGKIIKIAGHKIIVEYSGQTSQVLVGNEPIKIGDYVMVQMGIVIKILSPKEAALLQKAWSQN